MKTESWMCMEISWWNGDSSVHKRKDVKVKNEHLFKTAADKPHCNFKRGMPTNESKRRRASAIARAKEEEITS